MKKTMSVFQWAAGFLFSAGIVAAMLITAFEIAMYSDFDVYRHEYEKYDVLSQLDMTMDDAMYVTHEMMAYLRGDREELSVTVEVDGRQQDFFNEQDRFHMGEVRDLFIGGLNIRRISLSVALLCFIFLMFSKARVLHVLSRTYQVVFWIIAISLIALGVACAVDFNRVFVLFHHIFFDNNKWLFDPAEDYMIRMLPEGLFFDMVVRIGFLFFLPLLIMLLLSLTVTFKEKKKVHN